MINTKAVIKNFIKHPFKASGKIHKFLSHLRKYNKLNTRKDFHASPNNFYFCLNDWDAQAGSLGVYFYQDLWAAKKIFALKPSEHFDIGSRVDGFIAHVLPFMPLTMIDIRPLSEKVEGLKFIQADATNLDGIADNSIISLSSLCAPEHFGLGRYGDPIDPEACFKALKSMQRVLAKGGHLYIAVPVGEQSGVARELLEGWTMFLAVAVLFYVSNWMLSKADNIKWENYIKGMVQQTIDTKSQWTLIFAAFIAVMREGAELILFYSAAFTGGMSNPVYIAYGIGAGILVLVAVWVAFRYFSVKLPLKAFFMFTSILLYDSFKSERLSFLQKSS